MIKVIQHSKIKASKLKKHLPCEDNHAVYQDETKTIMVVADGHGDERCVYANVGSKLACKAAIELFKDIDNYDDIDSYKQELVALWRKKVYDHYSTHHIEENIKNILYAYGTTLLISIYIDHKAIIYNIGDGMCVYWKDKDFVSLIKTESLSPDSMCDINAPLKMETYVIEEPIAFMLSTDGIGGSVDYENHGRFFKTMVIAYNKDRKKYRKMMKDVLDFYSHDDDITIVWMQNL